MLSAEGRAEGSQEANWKEDSTLEHSPFSTDGIYKLPMCSKLENSSIRRSEEEMGSGSP